jgi:hypothetical protein
VVNTHDQGKLAQRPVRGTKSGMMNLFSREKKVSVFQDLELEELPPLVLVDEPSPLGGNEGEGLDFARVPPAGGRPERSEGWQEGGSRGVSCHRAKYAFWWMPSSGVAKDDCGEFLKRVRCVEDDHDDWVILRHCDDPRCPVCWDHWAGRGAFRAGERFLQAEPLWRQLGHRLGVPKHVTFSPPQEEATVLMATKEGFRRLRKSLVKWARWAGMVGGAVVFHPFRERGGSWFPSPHFHVVGYGYLVPADVFHGKSGWVYKNLGIRDSVPGTIKYALTHCGVAYDDDDQRMFHALTWFGKLSYNQIVIDTRERGYVTVPCSVCGGDLHEFDQEGVDDRGLFLLKVERTRWKLRKKLVQSTLPPPRNL